MDTKSNKQEDVNRPLQIRAMDHQTALEATTEFLLRPSLLAAKVIDSDKKQISKDHIDLQYAQGMLERSIEKVKSGNLEDVEAILFSQAQALNVMFTTLMLRANRQEYLPQTEALMTLAFKAQNQSRSTLQALVGLKQPTNTTFVKQANISQGHQQVNNLLEKNLNQENELLRMKNAKLDRRAATKTKRDNSAVEALDKVNRSKNY
jgi:plasmid stability protein